MSEHDNERLVVVETKIDHLDSKLDSTMEAIKEIVLVRHTALEDKVKTNEAHITWLWQTMFGTMLGGIISIIILFLK